MSGSRTITIEAVRAFNGLDVLVAQDEGLFEAEGLHVRIARASLAQAQSRAGGTLLQPTTNQGRLVDAHEADMFQG